MTLMFLAVVPREEGEAGVEGSDTRCGVDTVQRSGDSEISASDLRVGEAPCKGKVSRTHTSIAAPYSQLLPRR